MLDAERIIAQLVKNNELTTYAKYMEIVKKILHTVALSFLIGSPAFAHAPSDTIGEHDELVSQLRRDCYDVYKPQYDLARLSIPAIAPQDINLEDIGEIPEDIQASLGFDSEDLAELSAMVEEFSAFQAPYAQEAYKNLAQVNLDITNCYIEKLADEPELKANAEQLYKKAQADYDAISNYDFAEAFTSSNESTNTVIVPARSTKTVRLRTYCLDGGRGIPSVGETYYLAGSLKELQSEGICEAIQAGNSGDTSSSVQADIWTKFDTTPKASITPGERITNFFASIIAALTKVAGIPITTETDISDNSLLTASQNNEVIVEATSTGSFTSLDVTITNLTDHEITLDTSCLTFVPKEYDITIVDETEENTEETDINSNSNTNTENESDEDTSEDDANNEYSDDYGNHSQRLGSDNIIDDNPPPLPPDLPEPDDTLDLEELKKKIEEAVREAEKKFKDDPTEDTLKDFLKETQKCMLLGCGAEDAIDTVGENWQKAVDQAVDAYNNNPSQSNRDALQRATELGQMLGSDTSTAVDTLLNQ